MAWLRWACTRGHPSCYAFPSVFSAIGAGTARTDAVSVCEQGMDHGRVTHTSDRYAVGDRLILDFFWFGLCASGADHRRPLPQLLLAPLVERFVRPVGQLKRVERY